MFEEMDKNINDFKKAIDKAVKPKTLMLADLDKSDEEAIELCLQWSRGYALFHNHCHKGIMATSSLDVMDELTLLDLIKSEVLIMEIQEKHNVA